MIVESELTEIVQKANRESYSLGLKTLNRKGQQRMEYWLPESIKELLVAEHKRSDEDKTRLAVIKYFNPTGSGTWWFSEYDPEYEDFYGLAEIHEREYGYTHMPELRDLRVRFGLWIERDYHWIPKKLDEIE